MTTSEKILRTAVVSALFAVALALLSRLLFGVVNNALWTLSFGVPTWLIGIFWLIPFLLAYGLPWPSLPGGRPGFGSLATNPPAASGESRTGGLLMGHVAPHP